MLPWRARPTRRWRAVASAGGGATSPRRSQGEVEAPASPLGRRRSRHGRWGRATDGRGATSPHHRRVRPRARSRRPRGTGSSRQRSWRCRPVGWWACFPMQPQLLNLNQQPRLV
jgi:hypothetical protein